MEELQDAIEDAQYVNAIATQDDGPKPVIAWAQPTEEELALWKKTKMEVSASDNLKIRRYAGAATVPFSLEWILQQEIGLFLFSAFVKETANDYHRMNFCEEVYRFKKSSSRRGINRAAMMARNFLTAPPKDPETNEIRMPERAQINEYRTEIDEYDLLRVHPASPALTAEELKLAMENNMDYPNCSESVIGLKGSYLEELLTYIEEVSRTRQLSLTHKTPSKKGKWESPAPETADASAMAVLVTTPENGGVETSAMDSNHTQDAVPETAVADQAELKNTKVVVLSTLPEDVAVQEPVPETSTDDLSALDGSKSNIAEELSELPEDAPPQTITSEPSVYILETSASALLGINPRSIKKDLFDKAECILLESLRRDYWDVFRESPHYTRLLNFLWYQDRRVVPEDFFVMRVLGRGGFGLVTACKKGTSGKLYAMKVMNKKRIKMKKSEILALNERKALAAVESIFVANLKYSFHSKEDVYLILDLMTGGDLGYHLHQKGRFSKAQCLYYAARIMLALQALHDKKYVYRDLKPENCLLAEDGRVKITDLGLATKISNKLHGAAGTRGYWAPEMLRRDAKGKRLPYGHAVDWFSFGCCLAEFLTGSNPFRSEAALNFGLERGQVTKEKAIDMATLEMNPTFSPEKYHPDAADLCAKLLEKDEKKRLGCNGCKEIMTHPWFMNGLKSLGWEWEQILSDKVKPPFVPAKDVNAMSQSEIGTFAEDKAYQEIVIHPKDEEVYKDWDWTNPRAFAAEVIEFLIYERKTGQPLLPLPQHASCCCDIL